METKNLLKAVLFPCLLIFAGYSPLANNIAVSNISLAGHNAVNHFNMVKFDITWENSLRNDIAGTGNAVPYNWDAAWVFVKYRIDSGIWQHAWLDSAGHINLSGSTIATGLLNPDQIFNTTSNPGLGVFIYRDANGTGTLAIAGVQLRWNYGANGVNDSATIDIRVYAIELVYVPQGGFYAGSGGTETSAFYKFPATTDPYQITSEDEITVGTETDNIFYNYSIYGGDQLGPIPAAFPKGYNAFYSMKYEISQQGYVDFLNSLTQTQANTRKYTGATHRYAIF
ncbi:MAG: hypothetical protein WCK84_11255 [Bacteroidota bacterium]